MHFLGNISTLYMSNTFSVIFLNNNIVYIQIDLLIPYSRIMHFLNSICIYVFFSAVAIF